MKNVYLLLVFLGAVIPYSQFFPWLFAHGMDGHLLLHDLFANRISSFFALDLLITAVVAIGFMRREGQATKLPHLWAPIAATLLIGVSCGFPLFLYLRERQRAV